MSMEAIGAYYGALRARRGLSPMQVVAEIARVAPDIEPPHPNYIGRIEQGRIKTPGLRLIAALTKALKGDPVHVNALFLDDDATAEDGLRLARQILDPDVQEAIEELKKTKEGHAALREATLRHLQG